MGQPKRQQQSIAIQKLTQFPNAACHLHEFEEHTTWASKRNNKMDSDAQIKAFKEPDALFFSNKRNKAC